MTGSYGFTLDPNNFNQVGETRFFEIQADKESVEGFIKNLELFEKKRSEGTKMKPQPPKPPAMRLIKNGDSGLGVVCSIIFVLGVGALIGVSIH